MFGIVSQVDFFPPLVQLQKEHKRLVQLLLLYLVLVSSPQYRIPFLREIMNETRPESSANYDY